MVTKKIKWKFCHLFTSDFGGKKKPFFLGKILKKTITLKHITEIAPMLSSVMHRVLLP